MAYAAYRDAIKGELKRSPEGKTWRELKSALQLPQARACPEWTAWLERDIGLVRREKRGNALVWRIA